MHVLANLLGLGLLTEAFPVPSEKILTGSPRDLYNCIQGVFGNGPDR